MEAFVLFEPSLVACPSCVLLFKLSQDTLNGKHFAVVVFWEVEMID